MIEKRRTLWVNDKDWAAFQERAKAASLTPSAYLRSMVGPPRMMTRTDPILREDVDDHHGGVAPIGRPVVETDGSWTPAYRPVPKPGAKKR